MSSSRRGVLVFLTTLSVLVLALVLVYYTRVQTRLVFVLEPVEEALDTSVPKPPVEGTWWPGFTCRVEVEEVERALVLETGFYRERGRCALKIRGPRLNSVDGLMTRLSTRDIYYETPVVYLSVLGDYCAGFTCYLKDKPEWRTVEVASVPILYLGSTVWLRGNYIDRAYLFVSYEYVMAEVRVMGITVFKYWLLTPKHSGGFQLSKTVCTDGSVPCEHEYYEPLPKPFCASHITQNTSIYLYFSVTDRTVLDPVATTPVAIVLANITTYARVHYYGTPDTVPNPAPYIEVAIEPGAQYYWYYYWFNRGCKLGDYREILFTREK